MRRRQAWKGYGLLGVQVIGFFIFYLYPLVLSGWKSFTGNGIQYEQLFQTGAFFLAIKNTLIFAVSGIPLLFLISFYSAIVIQRICERTRAGTFLMTLQLVPMIIPSGVIAFVSRLFFEKYGIVNGVIGESMDWLHSGYAWMLLMFIFIWKNYGYCMIILLGGLAGIPKETMEAARMDGAGTETINRKIIVPQMKSYITFTMMMEVVGLFKVFRESYMLFGNYPDEKVYMLQNFMNNCFYSLNYNKLAAASTIVVILLILLVSVIVVKEERRRRLL